MSESASQSAPSGWLAGAVLSDRRDKLLRVISDSLESARPQSRSFALRILGGGAFGHSLEVPQATTLAYGGYPELAYLGFVLGAGFFMDQAPTFVHEVRQVMEQGGGTYRHLEMDDIALLGVADGLAGVSAAGHEIRPDLRQRLFAALVSRGMNRPESERLRMLAAELIEPRGRMATSVPVQDAEAVVFDLVLRKTWPAAFRGAPAIGQDGREEVFRYLLAAVPPGVGDLERAAAWLVALDALLTGLAREYVASVDDVVELLQRGQTALKRWVWEEKPRRSGAVAARWLVDNEYHVQSILWTFLYPVFGPDLRDEEYLASYGLKQPRFDLAIPSLRLIIEVKHIRDKRGFSEVEEQIAGDLGLYFTPGGEFDRLIVFVYDDSDKAHPELDDVLRSALMKRDSRVVDVIIVRRPGMIPPRRSRNSA